MGAAISGTAAVAGQEATIDASFSDILSNLQFGAMGLVVARKGNWGAYTELGGFGVGSKLEWQIFPTIGIDLSKHVSLEFGYRWLDMDYESGENLTFFKYDALTQGAVMGFAFRF